MNAVDDAPRHALCQRTDVQQALRIRCDGVLYHWCKLIVYQSKDGLRDPAVQDRVTHECGPLPVAAPAEFEHPAGPCRQPVLCEQQIVEVSAGSTRFRTDAVHERVQRTHRDALRVWQYGHLPPGDLISDDTRDTRADLPAAAHFR